VRRAVALVLVCAACSDPAPPRARADRISTRAQLIGGPKALGDIGDWLLENDQIRLVIEDKGPGRSVTLFGGSLLDADLVRPNADGVRGNDQLTELLPGFLLEVMEPTEILILDDGASGGPARIALRGVGGDLLQSVAVLNAGLVFPASLGFEQVYSLAPGRRYVEITTTVTNESAAPHPLPFLDPPELRDLGLDIPGLDEIELSVPFGTMLLLGHEQHAFAPGPAGFNVRFTIEDSYETAAGFPAFPGLVSDFVATSGDGVSYGIAVPAEPSNYPTAFRELYGDQTVKPTSLLLPFVYSSLTGVYSAQPPPVIGPGESFSYTTYFIVGRGDVASVGDVVYELHGVATGSFAGRVFDADSQAPAATSIVVLAESGDDVVTQVASDARGAFRCNLPPGRYRYLVVDDDRPRAEPVEFAIAADTITSVRIEVAPSAHLALVVRDERGRVVPARATVVGEYDAADVGRDPRDFLYSLREGERMRGTAFDGRSNLFIEDMILLPAGRGQAAIRPGRWEVWVTRGPEYEAARFEIDLAPGTFAAREVQLERAYPTDGWLAGDFHLHSANSPDSTLSLRDRVASLAAEGIEFAAATDHNFVTDYDPSIAAQGLEQFLAAVPGLELTTFEMGHFNGYPLAVDPGRTRGGSFVWTGKTPDELFAQLRTDLASPGREAVVQVNHPRDGFLGYFNSYHVDPDTGEPGIPPGLRGVFAPYGEEFQPEAFSWDFDAIEVANGKRQELLHTLRVPDPVPPGDYPDGKPVPGDVVVGDDGKAAFPGHIEDWFVLLNRGLRPTAMGNSDSHGIMFEEPGYARSLVEVGAGRDEQGAYAVDDVMAGIRGRRVVITNGPFIEARIGETGIGGDVTGDRVTLSVRVRSPSWAPIDRVTVWVGGQIGAQTQVPAERATDFSADFVLAVDADSFAVVEASGTQSMFPILTMQEFESLNADAVINALGAGLDLSGLAASGPLTPDRTIEVTPHALTNPIWIDADGDGTWTPPLPPIARKRRGGRAAPLDVVDAFRSAKDVSR
jgi:hypothetical protein